MHLCQAIAMNQKMDTLNVTNDLLLQFTAQVHLHLYTLFKIDSLTFVLTVQQWFSVLLLQSTVSSAHLSYSVTMFYNCLGHLLSSLSFHEILKNNITIEFLKFGNLLVLKLNHSKIRFKLNVIQIDDSAKLCR